MRSRRSALSIIFAFLVCGFGFRTSAESPLPPYPAGDELYSEIRAFAGSHPDLVSLETIGMSVEGREILALHFSRRDGKDKPAALVTGNIHAGECIGAMVAIAAARELAERDGKTEWITAFLDGSDVYIIPVHNPDGYYRVISSGGKPGKTGSRKNANGVDLNRNFPLAPGAGSRHPLSGNRRPRSSYYMGPEQLSEPETRAIAELVGTKTFYAAVILHSVAGKFLYPYCHTRKPAPDEAAFIRMGAAFTDHQPYLKYRVQQSYSWYPTLGDSDDYLYIHHGILSVTVEVGTIKKNLLDRGLKTMKLFWTANPGNVDYWVENDSEAVLAAITEALEITAGRPVEH